MAILSVVLYPDEPLQEKAEPVEDFDKDLRIIVKNMYETMEHHDGVGLAAPQIGISRRFFVMREPEKEPRCLVNPEIIEADGREDGEEGCLSLPQLFATVPRATRIKVRGQDEHGEPIEIEAKGLLARIIQHEIDHLNGVIFLDRVDILTRQSKLAEWDEMRPHFLAGASRE